MGMLAIIGTLLAGFAASADLSGPAYQKFVEDWRAAREARLKAEDGWLTVVGLAWLKEGENRVGSNPNFEIPLPKSMPERVGIITLKNGKAHFKPAPGVGVTINGKPATEVDLRADPEKDSDVVALGQVKFFVINRGNKLGVRVRDNDSDQRKGFTGLKWYAVDPAWRIQGNFVPWDKPRELTFETAVGVKERDESPGSVAFRFKGKEYRLEPTVDGDQLWFVMKDLTSGKTTYPASRFLYTDLPKGGVRQSGPVVLDFNKAENPPCAFTDFATCPLPPPQNRLPFEVTGGERLYGGGHR